jgi:hypothetical protein
MINKQDYDQLLVQAASKLTGAASSAIKNEFYDVLTEFLNDSSAWTEDVPFTVIGDNVTRVYPLQVTEGQIVRLAIVVDSNKTPQPALMYDVGTVTLAFPANTNQTFTATFVKNVYLPLTKDDIPVGPDWLLPVWHVGLLDGILGKMFNTPGRAYSSDTKALYHLKRFRDAITRARISKLRANTNGSQAWSFPQGFRTRTQRGGVPSGGANGNERMF